MVIEHYDPTFNMLPPALQFKQLKLIPNKGSPRENVPNHVSGLPALQRFWDRLPRWPGIFFCFLEAGCMKRCMDSPIHWIMII